MSSKFTRLVYGRGFADRARQLAPGLLVVLLVGGVSVDNGGYDATAWGWSTLVPLAVVVVVLAAGAARRPARLGRAFLGLLATFAVWTWLSAAWSTDLPQSVLEGERMLVYVAAGAALLALRRTDAARVLAGLLAAIVLVCFWGLAAFVFGGSSAYDVGSAAPDAARRLAAPVGYSNALGLLAAMGLILALGFSVRSRARARRVLSCAPVPVLGAALYLTYSRGAVLALGAGAVAALALGRPRAPRLLVWVGGIALLAAVVLLLVRLGGPEGALHAFTRAGPTVKGNENRRLLSFSGSSRSDYWSAAWNDYSARPWLGSGAGSFQRYWLRHRLAALPVRDAHSLYLETLAELGPAGLALLAALLAVPLVAAWRARDHPLASLAFGGYVAYLVHAAQDWDWELPAVTLAALACAVVLLLLAERETPPAFGTRSRVAGALVGVLLAAVALVALAGNAAIAAAQDALDRDRPAQAAADARSAERWALWSPDPWRLRGEAELALGEVEQARASFRLALRRDTGDWETWLDLGLASTGAVRQSALEQVARLNPLSSELRQLHASGG